MKSPRTDRFHPEVLPAATPAPVADVARQLELEQLRLYYHYLPASQLVAVINALVFVVVQSLVIRPPVLIGWLYAVCMLALVRILGGMAFRRAGPGPGEMARWRRYAIAGAAASGIIWGLAALLLFPPMNVAHQVFVAFVLGGMVAGSVTTLAPILPAFAAFAVLSLVPAIVRFGMEGEIIQYAMSWMTVVFLVAVIMIARRSHYGMVDLLKLRFENTALVEELQRSHEGLERRVAERTEELSRTNAELQRFAYVASHDLQEPLRNAANFALLLDSRYRDRLDTDGREYLNYIVAGVKQMRALVGDLLSHSRLGTAPQLAATDSGEIVERAKASVGAAIGESGAVVTCDALPVVQADARQLEQVFVNLLSNAIKFHGAEMPRVHVSCEPKEAEWIFSVRDNGIGIDPAYSGQIFEMFERLHSQADYPGTGIGLAVCKKIIEGHHGRIWVDSAPGRGAVFSFTLPRAGRDPGIPGRVGAADRGPAGRGQPG